MSRNTDYDLWLRLVETGLNHYSIVGGVVHVGVGPQTAMEVLQSAATHYPMLPSPRDKALWEYAWEFLEWRMGKAQPAWTKDDPEPEEKAE